MDTFSEKQLIIIGFDKYYARMLELEGLDIGIPSVKFDTHFTTGEIKTYTKNKNACFSIINSDVIKDDGDLFALIRFLNSECERTAVISSHRIPPDASNFILENPITICHFKRPVLITELLAFLHKENEIVRTHHSEAVSIKISPDTHSASFSGNIIYFTKTEFDVLELLLNAQGQPVSRKEIFKAVWQNDGDDSNIADVYIRYIRKKFKKFFDFDVIKTVRGVGYSVNTNVLWQK